MARIILTTAASNDQDAILRDLFGKAGLRTTEKYRRLFTRLFDLLSDHPAIGAPRPALGQSIRIGIVTPYIVIYVHTAHDDTVTVLRIVHGRRRISGELLSE